MVSMKKKIIFILACLSLLSINGLLMSISHAQDDESEIVQADSYFNDDMTNSQPLMYDENGNVINPQVNNQQMPMAANGIGDTLDDVDRSGNAYNNFGDDVNTDANTDTELVSGSAPIYNQ